MQVLHAGEVTVDFTEIHYRFLPHNTDTIQGAGNGLRICLVDSHLIFIKIGRRIFIILLLGVQTNDTTSRRLSMSTR